jgi:hypothetical protein
MAVSFTVEVESGDAALTEDPSGQLIRLLKQVQTKLMNSADEQGGPLFDVNGNRCGFWCLEIDEELAHDDDKDPFEEEGD